MDRKSVLSIFIALILSQLPSYVAAEDMKKPLIVSLDGVEGVMYDVPEFLDPHLLEYQLSALGGSASLIKLDKHKPNIKEVDEEHRYSEIKSDLEDVIPRLISIKDKLEKRSGTIHFGDIQKSIQVLKSLEHLFRPDIPGAMPMKQHTLSVASLDDDEGTSPSLSEAKHNTQVTPPITELLFSKTSEVTTPDARTTEFFVSETTEYLEVAEESVTELGGKGDDSKTLGQFHLKSPFRWEIYDGGSNRKIDPEDRLFEKEWNWKSYNSF